MSVLAERKILLLTPQLPYPPDQGTSLRNFHIIRGLVQFHEIHLLSFAEPGQGATEGLGPLEELCAGITVVPSPQRANWQRLWRLLSDGRPDMAHRLQSAAYAEALRQVLSREQFDIVQIEGIELAAHIPLIRKICPRCSIVFDDHNAEADLQRRMYATDIGHPARWPAAGYSFIQWRRLRRFEAWVCGAADGVTVVSNADRDTLRELAPDVDPLVVPNCIDVEAYRQLAPTADATEQCDLLFIGKMDYRPNVDAVLWFGREIWPRLREARPNLTWAVVGKQPHPRLQSLAHEPGVKITGAVPRIEPYLANARVYVMPFRIGSGTRLKLIEALAAGVATVSTRVGAEGYPLVDGRHILFADEPLAFANVVLDLLQDEVKRRRLQAAGREFSAAYDWRRVIPRFNELYRQL